MRKGVWAVAAVFVAYAALYWYHVIAAAMPFDAQFAYFVGSCSVICMVLGLLLSARPRAVETAFGGLDRMYRVHKYLGVAALLLFIAHFATVPGGPPEGEVAATDAVSVEGGAATAVAAEATGQEADEAEEEELPIDLLGLIAMIGFTLLIIVTLNRKIPYHRWITSHRFMGLFFIVAAVHVFLVLYDGEELALLSPPGVALAVLLLAGLVAYGYKQLLYPRKEKHAFTLSAVNRLERATEVVLEPKKGRMFPFEPGQFAFVTIDADGFREAHPFTISSGAKEDGLRFTMKVLGDYTRRVRDELAAGADAGIEGPYGRFNPLRGPEKQVWVAGGNRDHALPVGPAHDGAGAWQDHPALLLRARGEGGAVLRRAGGARGRIGRRDDYSIRLRHRRPCRRGRDRERPWGSAGRLELLLLRSEADGRRRLRRIDETGGARAPHPQGRVRISVIARRVLRLNHPCPGCFSSSG